MKFLLHTVLCCSVILLIGCKTDSSRGENILSSQESTGSSKLIGRADSAYFKNDFLIARRNYEEFIASTDTISGQVFYRLGFCYFQTNSMARAEAYLLKAVEKKYEVGDAYYLLGLINLSQNKCEIAIPYFEKSLAINNEDKDCKRALDACRNAIL